MSVFGFSDAFHIVEPMLSGTPLTAWVIAPIYIAGYAGVLLTIELVRRHKNKKQAPVTVEAAAVETPEGKTSEEEK